MKRESQACQHIYILYDWQRTLLDMEKVSKNGVTLK